MVNYQHRSAGGDERRAGASPYRTISQVDGLRNDYWYRARAGYGASARGGYLLGARLGGQTHLELRKEVTLRTWQIKRLWPRRKRHNPRKSTLSGAEKPVPCWPAESTHVFVLCSENRDPRTNAQWQRCTIGRPYIPCLHAGRRGRPFNWTRFGQSRAQWPARLRSQSWDRRGR